MACLAVAFQPAPHAQDLQAGAEYWLTSSASNARTARDSTARDGANHHSPYRRAGSLRDCERAARAALRALAERQREAASINHSGPRLRSDNSQVFSFAPRFCRRIFAPAITFKNPRKKQVASTPASTHFSPLRKRSNRSVLVFRAARAASMSSPC